METTKLSSKGQVILPKAVRDAHNWQSGTEFSVEDVPEGVLLKPIKRLPRARLEDVAGCLKYDGPAKTIEQMDEAIKQTVKKRHDRGRY